MGPSQRGIRSVRVVVAVAALALGAGLLTPTPAGAAGVTTHGWMAVEAIDEVADPGLQALLRAHEDQVRAGAMFPDAGYLGSNTYGEEAHWQRFVDAYVDLIAARDDCGPDLADPEAPCADMIAHAFGIAGHGMGDEVWDWLFEPNSPDRNEYYTNGLPTANEGGAETQMDLVAVGVHGVPRPTIPPLPDIPTLLQAFDNAGFTGVTESQFALQGLGELIWDLETQWAAVHLAGVQAAMPWMSANIVTAPGGVDFAATAIAGYWSSMWGRLQGAQPATEVSITYPADGQTDIPSTGWVRSYQPGSSRGRGGAATRITAVLTYARPYAPPGGSGVPAVMAAGTMTITDVATGSAVPIMDGFPRSAPYGGDAGQHLIDVQPAADLAPCSWYRVDVGVTTPVLDASGTAVTPHSWQFRTACTPNQIAGTVTGPDDAPVAGARVLAYRPTDGFVPTAETVTDGTGRYELAGIPDGEYRLVFGPPDGSGLRVQWAGNAASRTSTTPVVMPGSAAVDFRFEAAAVLAGRVTDANGAPVSGADVYAVGPFDIWVPTGYTTTAADGTYQFPALPAADYVVAARSPIAPSPIWWSGTTERSTATPVTVATDDHLDIDFVLPA